MRDAAGRLGDYETGPLTNAGVHRDASWSLVAVDGVDTRADLLKAEEFVMGDRYLFLRDAFLSRRAAANKDGAVSDEFGEEEFEDLEDLEQPE